MKVSALVVITAMKTELSHNGDPVLVPCGVTSSVVEFPSELMREVVLANMQVEVERIGHMFDAIRFGQDPDPLDKGRYV